VNRIGRMDNHSVALREAGAHFGVHTTVVSDLEFPQTRFAIFDDECHPVVAASEKRAGPHLENVIAVPGDNPCLHPVAIAEIPTGWCWIHKVNTHFHALFFHTKRRYFREGSWLDYTHPSV
jgi:hypothetical protein